MRNKVSYIIFEKNIGIIQFRFRISKYMHKKNGKLNCLSINQ